MKTVALGRVRACVPIFVVVAICAGSTAFAFDTPQHSAAARAARESTCARHVISARQAEQFINDPDCFGNNCEWNDITEPPKPGKDPVWAANQDFSLAWACRNWDHFTDNKFGWTRVVPPRVGADGYTEFANNSAAEDAMRAFADTNASTARNARDLATRIESLRNAIRGALRSAHYSTDRVACGHGIGNLVCDPRAASPSTACQLFVDREGNQERTGWKVDWFGIRGTKLLCSGQTIFSANQGQFFNIGDQLRAQGITPSQGLAYAAAERLMRHYSRGGPLVEFDDSGRATHEWRNACAPACENGECFRPRANGKFVAPGSKEETRLLADIVKRPLSAVCETVNPPGTTTNGASYRISRNNERPVSSAMLLDDLVLAPRNNNNIASEQIVAMFGAGLPQSVFLPGGGDLKDPADSRCSLRVGGRYAIRVSWGAGESRDACISFVGGRQANFVIPPGLNGQLADIEVRDEQTNAILAYQGQVPIGPVEPGIFTVAEDGKGVPAAHIVRTVGGNQSYDPIPVDPATPINVFLEGTEMYFVLYATGIRGRSAQSTVAATVGGVPVDVMYAGNQFGYLGLDQINLRVPTAPLIARRLNGASEIRFQITESDGRVWEANPVIVHLSTDPPALTEQQRRAPTPSTSRRSAR